MRPIHLLSLLIVLGAACSGREFTQTADVPATTVEVENRSFHDMTIYVLRGAQRVRLGRVTGMGSEIFTIPEDVVRGATTLRFIADPLGGAAEVSREMAVVPGDMLQFIVPD